MPYTSDSWTFGHVPTTFKRLPTVNRWGVLHGFYSDQRDDQELSNSAPDMPSGVGFRILANRIIWRFPNIQSWLTAANGYFFAGNATGAFSSAGYMSKKTTNNYAENSSVDYGYGGFNLNAETFNPLYGNSSTVQPAGLYGMFLIRF